MFALFLETLCELVSTHKADLQDWTFALLTRLLNKLGGDLLGSVVSCSNYSKLLSKLFCQLKYNYIKNIWCFFQALMLPPCCQVHKINKTLDVVRESFSYKAQLAVVFKFLVDQTQTPNSKVKLATLQYLLSLVSLVETADVPTTKDSELALAKVGV